MIKLHMIMPGGTTETLELEDEKPPSSNIVRLLLWRMERTHPVVLIEQVKVIWQGRPRAMFVDEDGIAKELGHNKKGTRIYLNSGFRNLGLHELLYEDLNQEPEFTPQQFDNMGIKGRNLVMTSNKIHGPAVLWEGEFE